MKIATYNINGVNGRLPHLLEWLDEAEPDVVCLQELKAPDDKFPESAVRSAGSASAVRPRRRSDQPRRLYARSKSGLSLVASW